MTLRTASQNRKESAGKTRAGRKAYSRDSSSLRSLPSIGAAAEQDLHKLGIRSPQELRGKDPYTLYRHLCEMDGQRYDPCLCDQFIAAVRYVDGGPPRDWWHYTAERKAHFAADGR